MVALARPTAAVSLCLVFIAGILSGCSGNGRTKLPPPSPIFTSSASASAVEGTAYTYQLSATDPAGGTVSFTLTQGPLGAALNGSTLTWTPTPEESRIADNFTVTATTTGGGQAMQTWSVTPSGTVHLSRVDSFWTANGEMKVPFDWTQSATASQVAALVPQADGSLQVLKGSGNVDGTFTIPNVPGGHYWLNITPLAVYWTSSSTFDFGGDRVGLLPKVAPSSTTTTFNLTATGLDPLQAEGWFLFYTDLPLVEIPFPTLGPSDTTTFQGRVEIGGNIDLSPVTSVFLMQYEPASAGSLSLVALGPEVTLPNPTFQDGATNTISGGLLASARLSVPLNIHGSEWATLFAEAGPTGATPGGSVLTVSAQPFVTGRLATPLNSLLGPDLPLISPIVPNGFPASPVSSTMSSCADTASLILALPSSLPTTSLPSILTDQDFGTVQYEDPFPGAWTRFFSFCEKGTVDLPIPSSTATGKIEVVYGQSTAVPTGAISPLISVAQNPTINGVSLMTSSIVNTQPVKLSWNAPSSGQKPTGYTVQLLVLATEANGTMQYFPSTKFTTTDTSMTLPVSLPVGQTFAVLITTILDGGANFEASPRRSELPTAHAALVSAPMTIGPATVPLVTHGDATSVPTGRPVETPADPRHVEIRRVQ